MSKEVNWNKHREKKSDPYFSRYPIVRPFGSIETITSKDGSKRKRGHFVNKKHTVIIHAFDNDVMFFLWENGILHYKSLNVKSLPSDLSLSRQASKFSKEVSQ